MLEERGGERERANHREREREREREKERCEELDVGALAEDRL
jgi:hypothetical protein